MIGIIYVVSAAAGILLLSKSPHGKEELQRTLVGDVAKNLLLPALGGRKLRETLRCSKSALEQCIGAEVTTFVPPYNQPFDHPRGWSFSISERRAVRHDRIDVARLCEALREEGYRFSRLSDRPLTIRLAEFVGRRELHRPGNLGTINGIHCLRTNTPCGFSPEARRVIEARLHEGGFWVLYGHPHSASDDGSSQSLRMLEATLELVDSWRREGKVRCLLPRDLHSQVLV